MLVFDTCSWEYCNACLNARRKLTRKRRICWIKLFLFSLCSKSILYPRIEFIIQPKLYICCQYFFLINKTGSWISESFVRIFWFNWSIRFTVTNSLELINFQCYIWKRELLGMNWFNRLKHTFKHTIDFQTKLFEHIYWLLLHCAHLILSSNLWQFC